MKFVRSLIALSLLAGVSACDLPDWFGGKEEAKKVEKPQAKAAAANAPKRNEPIEAAMGEIPPELRVAFQDALSCEYKRNPKLGNITPEIVRDLTARLKTDPSIAKCGK